MTHVSEIVGVLFAAATIVVLRGLWASSSSARTAGVGVLVVAALSVLFFHNAWKEISAFPHLTSKNERFSTKTAERLVGACGNTPFLDWAQHKILGARIAPTYWIEPAYDRNSFRYECSTWKLMPARETDELSNANWIVFSRIWPRHMFYDHAQFGRLLVYEPRYAIVERTHAG